MAVLSSLIKNAVKAILVSRSGRSALLAGIAGLSRWIASPSSQAKFSAFFSRLLRSGKAGGAGVTGSAVKSSGLLKNVFLGALELLLLKYARRIGFSSSGALALSALAALLWSAMRGKQEGQGRTGSRPSDQVIDVDDYTVIGE